MLFISLLFVAGAAIAQDKTNVDVFTGTVTIDGVEEEAWDAVEAVPFVLNFQTEVPSVTAYWKAMWDETYIYVLINVEDDDHYPSWESGGNSWEYDKPEIYFDVNDVLVDEQGVSAAGTGHYQLSPGFVDGSYDTPDIACTVSEQAPGGKVAYSLTGESYVYEHAVEITSMHNGDAVAMDVAKITTLPENVGFDATVIDQDQDVTTARQRTIWQSGDGTENEAWNSMDASGTITLKQTAVKNVGVNTVAVYPNPVNNYMSITAKFDKVVINNVLGQEVMTMSNIKNDYVDVSGLSKGIYIVKVYKGEKYIGAAKINKN